MRLAVFLPKRNLVAVLSRIRRWKEVVCTPPQLDGRLLTQEHPKLKLGGVQTIRKEITNDELLKFEIELSIVIGDKIHL